MSGDKLPSDTSDLAIARVIAAEADARSQIEVARADALTLIATAHHAAANIDARTTRRLARWLAHMQADHERALAQVEAPLSAIAAAPAPLARALTAAALVAAELTGAEQ